MKKIRFRIRFWSYVEITGASSASKSASTSDPDSAGIVARTLLRFLIAL